MESCIAIYIFLSSILLLHLLEKCEGGRIGVCYGRNADDLPDPHKVALLVQLHKIKYVRIYDSNIQVLKVFSNTGVDLMIGIPNSDLLSFSQVQSNADTWLKNTLLPYYPALKVSYITVGAEVTESPPNVSALLVPAMTNLLTALTKAGLHRKIKVSTTHSLNILSRSFPPSAAAFNTRYASFLKPVLDFLARNKSPFMVNIYPYFSFLDSPKNIPLPYTLFDHPPDVIDPNTGLLYSNLFDAQLDAVYYALSALDMASVNVVVTETGWPTKGSPAATLRNARTYNTNLLRHVTGASLPVRSARGVGADIYLFSLFNENRKPGPEYERNWGLFYPDETSLYNLDFTGRDSEPYRPEDKWCVASTRASTRDLQAALDWACGPGKVDCTAIQPSRPCFEPDNVASHASYAFNGYFQLNGASDVACTFGGSGLKVGKDPSYDKCIYTKFGLNKTTSKNLTVRTSSRSNPAASIFPIPFVYISAFWTLIY